MKKSFYLTIILFVFLSITAYTQDFGFGFDEPEEASSVSFNLSGEVSAEFPFYFNDFEFVWQDILRGRLNFNVLSNRIDLITSFNLSYESFKELGDSKIYTDSSYTPLLIDELFVRAYIGPVNIEAGYRKLTWGKADSSGPLDVTNPIDFTDLRHITDARARKIARPMLHITWNADSFSKLEGVFIPNFAGHRFASAGRWTPNQYSNMPAVAVQGILERASLINPTVVPTLGSIIGSMASVFSDDFPNTSSLDYFQAGLRYTSTFGSADFGLQYFYGNLFRPSFTVDGVDNFIYALSSFPPIPFPLPSPQLIYTRYHQFGVDYAQVLYGFNVRAELAFNLTEDTNGTEGSLHNPFIAWSLGFDRDLFWGININIQCNETIRLFNDKIDSNPVIDSEAGTNMTNTRLTTQLSKKFLRDNLETKAVFIWDIENSDCYIIPSVSYMYKDFLFDLTAGFFVGNKDGELGQYWKNSFVRFGVTYKF